MKFTGERYLPEFGSPDIAYEHWHRYMFASAIVKGKKVLDIASGEGYGSYLLAKTAKHVFGLDADLEAVTHAATQYRMANLEFRQGMVDAIPIKESHVFDVVVSFETIEHVGKRQQVGFAREIKRLLTPGGLFLVSTPDKLVYSDRQGYQNPYHQREFNRQEFLEFLRSFFRTVRLFGQRVYPVSYIWSLDDGVRFGSEYELAFSEGRFNPVVDDCREAVYMVALCTDGDVEALGNSILVDT